jgi:hemin uptake protein HemP
MTTALRELIEQATNWPRTVPAAVRSSELLAGHQRLRIQHGERIYELRVTRRDRLTLLG